MIEGGRTENIDRIDGNDNRLPTVRLIRPLSRICRRDKSFQMDTGGYINLEDILSGQQHTLTPRKLLAVIYTNPKARFQLTFPVYRVSGHGQRSFPTPGIGIRATCHSREDVGLEIMSAAQELLNYKSTVRPPVYCAHGTFIEAWERILKGTKSLTP